MPHESHSSSPDGSRYCYCWLICVPCTAGKCTSKGSLRDFHRLQKAARSFLYKHTWITKRPTAKLRAALTNTHPNTASTSRQPQSSSDNISIVTIYPTKLPSTRPHLSTMLNVTSGSIPWLAKGSPGYNLFADPPVPPAIPKYILAGIESDEAAPQRRIASRGTEVFVAAGCEIRCVDLRDLKARYEEEQEGDKGTETTAQGGINSEREYQVSRGSDGLRVVL